MPIFWLPLASHSMEISIFEFINLAAMLYTFWDISISSVKAAILDFWLPLAPHNIENIFIEFPNLEIWVEMLELCSYLAYILSYWFVEVFLKTNPTYEINIIQDRCEPPYKCEGTHADCTEGTCGVLFLAAFLGYFTRYRHFKNPSVLIADADANDPSECSRVIYFVWGNNTNQCEACMYFNNWSRLSWSSKTWRLITCREYFQRRWETREPVQNIFCNKPYVPKEPRRDPSNPRFYEHGICIRHNQVWNSQHLPSQERAESVRPEWIELLPFKFDLHSILEINPVLRRFQHDVNMMLIPCYRNININTRILLGLPC